MWIVLVLLCSVHAEFNYDNLVQKLYRRAGAEEPFFEYTWFNVIENYQVNALEISEDKHPWIARVVHSRSVARPHICTAVCMEERIFITAATCVYSARVLFTNVIYQGTRFSVKAFVIPSDNISKQRYDDIGFIVVNDEGYQYKWATVQLFDSCNRTDNIYNWFADKVPMNNWDHIVVGHATEKHNRYKYFHEDGQYKLVELKVVTGINICSEILIYKELIKGFRVPCYHSCSPEQYKADDKTCSNYLGTLGGAVFNIKTNKLLGIATWGPNTRDHELPVGFSVPNSDNFYKDLICARKIKSDKEPNIKPNYYQKLCNSK